MKYVKFKNNRFCKTFIFLFILVFGFSVLVYKSNNKVKAGVIIEEQFRTTNIQTITENNCTNKYLNIHWGSSNFDIVNLNATYSYNNTNLSGRCRVVLVANEISNMWRARVYVGSPGRQVGSTMITMYEDNDNMYIDLEYIYNTIQSGISNLQFTIDTQFVLALDNTYKYFSEKINAISSVSNIYELPQNSICLLYLEDISGLNTNDFAEEATIYWGYVDDDNSATFASYSPSIDIFNDTTNNVIKLSLPQNASGSVSTFKEISQNATFSLGDLYDATTTANIYAIYIYLQNDSIYWGFLNFDVPQTPAVPSAQSMQYITGSEQIYAFSYGNTNNMTCRLSISSNVNYITILNQSEFNVDNINSILRDGGFFPAWSLYNWSRGARLGYQAGYDAGEAPFKEGNVGYQAIFEAGYREGQADSIDTTFLVSLFDSVDAFFNIHLFPLITIGEIVGIPFIISVVWFIIRQLRGGGGAD